MPFLRNTAVVACVVGMWAATPGAQSPPPQPSPPAQFRAGVDLMRIDVRVLDRQTRRPVRGLTAADFTIKVGGQPQPIQAMAEHDTSAQSPAGPAWQHTAAHDVVTNAPLDAPRLVVIVMDDSQGGMWHRQAGKKVAHAIIDGLGASDLCAVVFVNTVDRAQDFTTDRTLLRAAVDGFDPLASPRFAAPNAPGTVRNVRRFLASVAQYPRSIMLITSRGYDLATGIATSPAWSWLRDVGTWDQDPDAANPLFEPASRLGHVPIYFFTTFGLTVSTNPMTRKTGDSTMSIAKEAGGRAIVENNAPHTEVPAVLDELSAHYTLAYAPTFPMDGKLRFADVLVARPDTIVLPASGAFRTARELTGVTMTTRMRGGTGSGLIDAVAAPLMEGALPLRLSTAAIPATGAREHMVAVTVGLPVAARSTSGHEFALTVFVFDGEGRKEVSRQTHNVTVSPAVSRTDTLAEVVLALKLAPGRYNLRVGAQSGETAGSAFTVVTVPDLSREPLTLSAVAIGRAEGRPIGGREVVAASLPFAPTTVRAFDAGDHVGALVTLHQSRTASDVSVRTEILDASGAVVTVAAHTVAAASFHDAAGHQYKYNLPLRTLVPGEYLLRIVASTARSTVRRDVRFVIH